MQEINPYPGTTEQEDLFSEGEFVQYTEASTQQRFFNYLIDVLVMRFGVTWASSYVLMLVLNQLSPDLAYSVFVEGPALLAAYSVGILNHLFYYTLCEKAFKGYTLGKLVTGTRAIREDGDELTFKDALLRSLCRLVPFETLSIWFGGGGPWHDIWTRTKVIQTR